jgi:exoribonuclease-2
MFPEDLSSQVLSLGASIDSFALSCGVVLSELGEIESFEVCPSKIRVTKKLSYAQLEEVLSKRDVHVASARLFEKFLVEDLNALNRWARVRHAYRVSNSALDVYMRDKTELYLSVKKDPKVPERRSLVSGYTVWTNGTSISLVSEYMILMSQTVGQYCAALDIPVLYKTQSPSTPLTSQDLLLQEGETPFIRATRLIKLVRPANDTRHPGRHCSSGANAYVQCTSPIRRYHDLYNHYRLKVTMRDTNMHACL